MAERDHGCQGLRNAVSKICVSKHDVYWLKESCKLVESAGKVDMEQLDRNADLHRDDAFFAYSLHGLGNKLSNFLLTIG